MAPTDLSVVVTQERLVVLGCLVMNRSCVLHNDAALAMVEQIEQSNVLYFSHGSRPSQRRDPAG